NLSRRGFAAGHANHRHTATAEVEGTRRWFHDDHLSVADCAPQPGSCPQLDLAVDTHPTRSYLFVLSIFVDSAIARSADSATLPEDGDIIGRQAQPGEDLVSMSSERRGPGDRRRTFVELHRRGDA